MEVQIVYFLSRNDFTENPHLIRVHHLHNNGVRLRDIKRWLGELRGKDMPESFAWSYKRKYKTGYIWQDLLDDDFVSPISDNELVLKGSEISPTNNTDQSPSDTSINTLTKLSSEIKESSPTFDSATSTKKYDDSNHKLEHDKNISDTINQSRYLSNKKNKSRNVGKIEENSISTANGAASSNKPCFAMSFWNLITCGGVDTKDSVVMTARDKKNRPMSNIMCPSYRSMNARSMDVCKAEKIGRSDDQTIIGKARRTRYQWSYNDKTCDGTESTKSNGQCPEEKSTYLAHKPVKLPNCAQCGKPFKPEKLHSHMKSCKGMKIFSKAENKSQISRNVGHSSSTSGYLRII